MASMRNDQNIVATRHRFDQSLVLLAAQEAGNHTESDDGPMNTFLNIHYDVTRNPIKTDAELGILIKAIEYLMAEGPEPFTGNLEDAIDYALEEALDYASTPLNTALLALIRHRLRGPALSA